MEDFVFVWFLCSRNKDNVGVKGFLQRTRTFLSNREEIEGEVAEKWEAFFDERVPGEFCRIYRSVNSRDSSLICENLAIALIKHEVDVCKINSKVTSIAAKADCAHEHKWLFDFDNTDSGRLKRFIEELKEDFSEDEIEVSHTPHGFAVVMPHGFDSRKVLLDFQDCATLKRDGQLLMDWGREDEW